MSPSDDGAGGGPVESGRDVEERALAGPRRAHHGGERPRSKPGADPIEGDDRALAPAMDLADVAERDGGGGGGGLASAKRGSEHATNLRSRRPLGIGRRPDSRSYGR